MAWNVWLVDTSTGANRVKVFPTATSWQRIINAGGSGQTTFNLNDGLTAEQVTWDSSMPRMKTLVVDWDKTVVYAGIITGRKYRRRTGLLVVRHSDPWWMLARRHMFLTNGEGFQSQEFTWSGQSLRTLAKWLVEKCFDPGSARYAMPITYAPNVVGPHSRTYHGYEARRGSDALIELMTTDDGPDIDFRPYWGPGNDLRYEFRAGNLNTSINELHVTAPNSGPFDMDFEDSADEYANLAFAIGQGSEKDVKAKAWLGPDLTGPIVEKVLNLSGEEDPAKLEAALIEHLDVYGQLATQKTFDIDADSTTSGVGVATLTIGGEARLYYQNDPWIARGWHGDRVISFSGDLSNKVSVSTQPLRLDT